MNVYRRTLLTAVFVILSINDAFSDGNCNQAKTSLAVVGVFNADDSATLKDFKNAISHHNSLLHEKCVPSLTYTTLLVKKEMGVQELMRIVDTALHDSPCFMVYASDDSKARIVLDIATRQGLNVITAVEEVCMIFFFTLLYFLFYFVYGRFTDESSHAVLWHFDELYEFFQGLGKFMHRNCQTVWIIILQCYSTTVWGCR